MTSQMFPCDRCGSYFCRCTSGPAWFDVLGPGDHSRRNKPTLTERQKAALDLLPAKDIEVGWELHRRRGCHQCQHAGHPCDFAASSGREVLSAIRRKTHGLVVRRHSGVWERLDGRGSQGQDIPF